MRAADDMFLPRIQFFGKQRTLVISRERFCIGTRAALERSVRGSLRGSQMAAERFVKSPVAFVRPHRLLHG